MLTTQNTGLVAFNASAVSTHDETVSTKFTDSNWVVHQAVDTVLNTTSIVQVVESLALQAALAVETKAVDKSTSFVPSNGEGSFTGETA